MLRGMMLWQVTINCAERGLLLLRVRDEMRMTIAAYQTLYESSVAFGMRKALQTEQGKADMETKIQQLEAEQKELERQLAEVRIARIGRSRVGDPSMPWPLAQACITAPSFTQNTSTSSIPAAFRASWPFR
jgi:hypothetical protein